MIKRPYMALWLILYLIIASESLLKNKKTKKNHTQFRILWFASMWWDLLYPSLLLLPSLKINIYCPMKFSWKRFKMVSFWWNVANTSKTCLNHGELLTWDLNLFSLLFKIKRQHEMLIGLDRLLQVLSVSVLSKFRVTD